MGPELTLPKRLVSTRAVELQLCIHEVFEKQAEKSPDAIAVTCGEAKLSYRELNERANRLAHHLQSSGICPETPVALYLERSLEMVVAILAVLKSGGAY